MNETGSNAKNVFCAKLKRDLPGLSKPPFPGELGQLIFKQISQSAWDMWAKDMQVKVINEYRLNMGEESDYLQLIEQMKIFLNLSHGKLKEVENATRGRGE